MTPDEKIESAAPAPLSLPEADAILTAPGAEFEIEKLTIFDNRIRAWKHGPKTLRAVLEGSRRHGEADFIVYEDERLGFGRHFAQAAALAAALRQDYGIEKGDRVAIVMRNYPEWSIAFWAITAIGAIVVPLNAWWKAAELHYGLEDSGSRIAIVDGERLRLLRDGVADLDLRLIATRYGEDGHGGADAWDQVLARHSGARELPQVAIEPEDEATIFYTSGTTGLPKGALGTHRNSCTNLWNLEFTARRRELRAGGPAADKPKIARLLSVPFFHVTGCQSTLLPSLWLGLKLVLMYRFDAERAVEIIERERITTFGGVPAVVWQILEARNFRDHDLSSVLAVGYGGAPAAPELVRRIKDEFPNAAPSNGYGMTETSAMAVSNGGDDYVQKPDSVGPPVPVCEARIVDTDGNELPRGEVGELWLRGPNVVKGYWNKPEATAEAFSDGWVHTGDLMRQDEEGFLYIVDRAKDMVIRGGENVYCVEVEAALFEHPAVMEAAVFGRPHRVLGEEVVATVRLRPGFEATDKELIAHTAERLAGFKVPVAIHLTRDDFPRNANGKILKPELKKRFAAENAPGS